MREPTLRDAEALVGLAYVEGRFTCAHLAAMAQRVLWGRHVGWAEAQRVPTTALGQHRALQAACSSLAHRLPAGQAPSSGDVALFIDPDHGWHIGTVLLHLGQAWVLHCWASVGHSVLQPLADLAPHGLRLEGFYRWRAERP